MSDDDTGPVVGAHEVELRTRIRALESMIVLLLSDRFMSLPLKEFQKEIRHLKKMEGTLNQGVEGIEIGQSLDVMWGLAHHLDGLIHRGADLAEYRRGSSSPGPHDLRTEEWE